MIVKQEKIMQSTFEKDDCTECKGYAESAASLRQQVSETASADASLISCVASQS